MMDTEEYEEYEEESGEEVVEEVRYKFTLMISWSSLECSSIGRSYE